VQILPSAAAAVAAVAAVAAAAAIAGTTIGLNTSIPNQYLHSTLLFVFLAC
jgi:hypothetical protein